jgi:hypothetical protein
VVPALRRVESSTAWSGDVPVVELDIGGTPTRVQVDEGFKPEDLDYIAKTMGPQTAVSEPQSRVSRALAYISKRGQEFVGAAQGVGKDVSNLATGKPYGAGFPEGRTGWQTAADVATTLGPPVVAATAPVSGSAIMGAGLAGGATAAALGAKPEIAEDIETGINVLGGAGTAVKGAVAGAKGAKALLASRYQQIAEAATKNGRTLDPERAMQLGDDLLEGLQSAFTKPKEMKAVKPLLDKLTKPGAGPITFTDLDEAKIATQGMKGRSYIRGLITDAQKAMLEGTPEGAAMEATNKSWRRVMGKPMLRGLHGGVTRGVAGLEAAREATEGRYKSAAGLAAGAVLGGLSPGQLIGAGRGIAGPALRAAALTAGSPGMQSAINPEQELQNAPEAPGTPEEPTQVPSPSVAGKMPQGPFNREIKAVSSVVGVPTELIQAIMARETGHIQDWNKRIMAVSPQGAVGLMQVLPDTFKGLKPRIEALTGREAVITDPIDNLIAGALYLKDGLESTGGSVAGTATRYHGGPNPRQWGPKTKAYQSAVTEKYASLVR